MWNHSLDVFDFDLFDPPLLPGQYGPDNYHIHVQSKINFLRQ